MTEKNKLHEILREMKYPADGSTYFAITLIAYEDGSVVYKAQSAFSGFDDDKPHYELRTASEVIPDKMLALWKSLKMPGIVVNNTKDMFVYSIVGGNAIVEKSICEKFFPSIFKEVKMVPTGLVTSSPIHEVEEEEFRRAPTPKLRMKILKRDNYRCRVCGRSSEENVDIVLHVHHFIPAEKGGLTNESNLITLCHTCHYGLDPHFDTQLSDIFQETFTELNEVISDEPHVEYGLGVKRYRELSRKRYRAVVNDKSA